MTNPKLLMTLMTNDLRDRSKKLSFSFMFRLLYLSLHQIKPTCMNKINPLLLTGIALILMQACGSPAKEKETDLPVRKSCNLTTL